MPKIPLSDPTYQRLLRQATSFNDTAEDVIARLLDQAEGANDQLIAVEEPSRAAPGSVLPVRGYWVPILRVLAEAGGAAPANDVIESLKDQMKDVLTPRDLQPLKSGEIRWRNRARFARLRMKERGLISDSSHRGVWEITTLGRKYLDLEKEEAAEE